MDEEEVDSSNSTPDAGLPKVAFVPLANSAGANKPETTQAVGPAVAASSVTSFEEKWQKQFNLMISKELDYKEYMRECDRFIRSTNELIKQNKNKDLLLSCYDVLMRNIPIKMFSQDKTWTSLLESFYKAIYTGEISYAAAYPILENASNKFAYSLNNAEQFWKLVFYWEKKILTKAENTNNEQFHQSMCELYKKRFSFPYPGCMEDYKKFLSWAKQEKVCQSLISDIRKTYIQQTSTKIRYLAVALIAKHKDELPIDHNQFEQLVHEICQFESMNFHMLQTICEEMIAERPDTICYYWIYLNALSSVMVDNKIEPMPYKIKEIIVRGMKAQATQCCSGMAQRFCEQMFVVAGRHMAKDKVLELINSELSNATANSSTWHALSRGSLIAIGNLVVAGEIDPDILDTHFYKLIQPCTMRYFSSNDKPEMLEEDPFQEPKYLDLLQLWFSIKESFLGCTWEKTLEMWTNIFYECSNPILLVGYVDFVKNRGSSKDSLDAIKFALDQLVNIDECDSLYTMRCHIKLLKDHLDSLSKCGDANKQVAASIELQSRLNSYSKKYTNHFNDFINTTSINGFCPFEGALAGTSNDLQDLHITEHHRSSIESSLNKLRSLRVAPDQTQTDMRHRIGRDEDNDSKLFASNISYTAQERDLASALRKEGFYPSFIRILKNQEGKTRGLAHLTFNSKEEASRALLACDKLDVCGRPIRLSRFNTKEMTTKTEKPIKPVLKPTVLTISGVDPEWKNKDNINQRVSQYGHVKDLTITDPNETTFCVRIEFHMPEDAFTVHQKITEDGIFGTNVISRMGYTSNKKRKEVISKPKSEMKTTNSRTSPTTTTKEDSVIGPLIPQDSSMPTIVKKTFYPIPRQLLAQDQPRVTKRTHMKSRLNLSDSSSSSSTMSSVVSSEEGPERKLTKIGGESDTSISSVSTLQDSTLLDTSIEMKELDESVSLLSEETLNAEVESAMNQEGNNVAASNKPLTNQDFQNMYKKN